MWADRKFQKWRVWARKPLRSEAIQMKPKNTDCGPCRLVSLLSERYEDLWGRGVCPELEWHVEYLDPD